MPFPSATPDPTVVCPACGGRASGKFCSSCGASLAGTLCGACGAALSPGARFCHRCGTPAGADTPEGEPRSFSAALPWGVAAIALVAVIALIAGQRFSRQPAAGAPGTGTVAPFAGATGNGQAPDISNLTAADAASRLYDRIMMFHEAGKADSVKMFAPMAIQAYQMAAQDAGSLNPDQHYDVGRIAAISGDAVLAQAEADTILAADSTHLLGLILAGNAAHMTKDAAAERRFHDKLVAAAATERAKQLPEYSEHANDITIALDTKRP
jgi:hypothetical protein